MCVYIYMYMYITCTCVYVYYCVYMCSGLRCTCAVMGVDINCLDKFMYKHVSFLYRVSLPTCL